MSAYGWILLQNDFERSATKFLIQGFNGQRKIDSSGALFGFDCCVLDACRRLLQHNRLASTAVPIFVVEYARHRCTSCPGRLPLARGLFPPQPNSLRKVSSFAAAAPDQYEFGETGRANCQ